MIAYPALFNIVYLVPIVWLAVTLYGVEHWLFALQYYYGSLSIKNKLESKSAKEENEAYKSPIFLWVAISFSVFEAGCCAVQYLLILKEINLNDGKESV